MLGRLSLPQNGTSMLVILAAVHSLSVVFTWQYAKQQPFWQTAIDPKEKPQPESLRNAFTTPVFQDSALLKEL